MRGTAQPRTVSGNWNLWAKLEQLPLILGWRLTTELQLEYWYDYASQQPNTDARPGDQPEESLALVSPEHLQNHVAIIAQSGAGKSVFLGRLLEELCLRTGARCLILDPNADFRRFNHVKKPQLWKDASYSPEKGGQLPHEIDRAIFEDLWSKLDLRIRTARFEKDEEKGSPIAELHIVWPCVPLAMLAADAPPSISRLLLQEFHTVFHSMARLKSAQAFNTTGKVELATIIAEMRQLLTATRQFEIKEKLLELRRAVPLDDWGAAKTLMKDSVDFAINTISQIAPTFTCARPADAEPPQELQEIHPVADYYLTRLEQILRANLAKHYNRGFLAAAMEPSADIEVIDLPSIPNRNDRMLALGALLASEVAAARRAWQTALTYQNPKEEDFRRPTYIVIDEAHHLAPNDTQLDEAAKALREQLRTIAGEGRKFGVFLVVVSQRPDKLDDVIVSECANKALMKHDTAKRFRDSCTALGLNEVSSDIRGVFADRARKGMVLMTGPWANPARLCYAAARRTIEGGRDLIPENWGRTRERLRIRSAP